MSHLRRVLCVGARYGGLAGGQGAAAPKPGPRDNVAASTFGNVAIGASLVAMITVFRAEPTSWRLGGARVDITSRLVETAVAQPCSPLGDTACLGLLLIYRDIDFSGSGKKEIGNMLWRFGWTLDRFELIDMKGFDRPDIFLNLQKRSHWIISGQRKPCFMVTLGIS